MSGQQFFSEKEVGEIVKRASELQEKSSGEGGVYTPGVSRDELARVAKEMGIDEGYLDRAIQERLSGKANGEPGFLGARFVQEYDKVIPGELPLDDFDVVMEEIGPRRRAQFTSQVGRMLSSQVTSGIGHARLSVNSRDGRTRLRVRSLAIFSGLITLYPAFILAVISSANIAEHMRGVAGWLIPAIWAAAMTVGWSAFVVVSRKGHAAIRDLTERIAARIAEVTGRQTESQTEKPQAAVSELENKA